ncbi:MAG TPA: sugar phosphate isomerase/epimerase [Bryobacteraceae bacterium]|nr:sugar phosphate isomerase/epimerase [Bryobacteraceae bacterium]
MISRRTFLAGAAGVLAAQEAPRYRVGITTNTRGGWEKDVFLSFREAHEVGYRYVESFIEYFGGYLDKPAELLQKTNEIGVKFDTISNGGRMEMHFEDPAQHEKIIEQHMRLARFLKSLGCDHMKINTGSRRPTGTTDQDLKNMAAVFDMLGHRIVDETGLKFGVHAHMWTQFENRHEIETVMAATNPDHVKFVLDTGQVTVAGIDPVELTRALGHRIIEFHLKDTLPEYRGGAKKRIEHPNDAMKAPIFFELGKGGVDFPAIKSELDRMGWRGWLTVELDSSPYRPPKESARISKDYIEKKLGIQV